ERAFSQVLEPLTDWVQIPAPPPPFFNRISCLLRRFLRLQRARTIFPNNFFASLRLPTPPPFSPTETRSSATRSRPPIFLYVVARLRPTSGRPRVAGVAQATRVAVVVGALYS